MDSTGKRLAKSFVSMFIAAIVGVVIAEVVANSLIEISITYVFSIVSTNHTDDHRFLLCLPASCSIRPFPFYAFHVCVQLFLDDCFIFPLTSISHRTGSCCIDFWYCFPPFGCCYCLACAHHSHGQNLQSTSVCFRFSGKAHTPHTHNHCHTPHAITHRITAHRTPQPKLHITILNIPAPAPLTHLIQRHS